MGGKSSKKLAPANQPDSDILGMSGSSVSASSPHRFAASTLKFKCKVKETGEQRYLAVEFPSLFLLSEEQQIMATFPIKFLRGYGQLNSVFSFETGRKCPGGVQTYFFVIDGNANVFQALNDEIKRQSENSGDSYDHLPAFGGVGGSKTGTAMSTSSSTTKSKAGTTKSLSSSSMQSNYAVLDRNNARTANNNNNNGPAYSTLNRNGSNSGGGGDVFDSYDTVDRNPAYGFPGEQSTYDAVDSDHSGNYSRLDTARRTASTGAGGGSGGGGASSAYGSLNPQNRTSLLSNSGGSGAAYGTLDPHNRAYPSGGGSFSSGGGGSNTYGSLDPHSRVSPSANAHASAQSAYASLQHGSQQSEYQSNVTGYEGFGSPSNPYQSVAHSSGYEQSTNYMMRTSPSGYEQARLS